MGAGSPDRNCGPQRTHTGADFFLKDSSLWRVLTLEQFFRDRSPRKGPMLEQRNSIGGKCQEKGVAEMN